MSSEIELFSDGSGLAVIGNSTDVERFLLDQGLGEAPSRSLDLHRLSAWLNRGASAVQTGADLAANSGRWVKLTSESAAAVHKYGLMATKTPNVSHAMIGKPGDIRQWLQIAQAPTSLLGNPMALTSLSTMMQQHAMQQQMAEIVEYLEMIDEKVDDILRAQKDSVLSEMIGVDLVLEDAMAIRDASGKVSETAWSKVQGTSHTIAKTQAYAVKQLQAIAEKLERKADLGEIAKATRDAEPKVREWLAVIARCVQLQDGLSVLELDRVFDAEPDDLESHRLGLITARQKRLDLIGRTTARLLTQMDETVRKANAKVLFNPFDAPAAVRSSNKVSTGVIEFRGRLGIESGHEAAAARRWGQAAAEVRDKAVAKGAEGAAAAKRFGDDTFERAAEVFRAVDLDGDGVPDKSRAAAAAEEASAAIKGAAAGVAGAFGGLFQRKRDAASSEGRDSEPARMDEPGRRRRPRDPKGVEANVIRFDGTESVLEVPGEWQRLNTLPEDPPGAQLFAYRDDAVGVLFATCPIPAEEMMSDDLDEVVREVGSAMLQGAGLVEAGVGATDAGASFVYTIVKNPLEPSGLQYNLTLHLALAVPTQIQGFFDELGITGRRETMVLESSRRDGTVTLGEGGELQGWWIDQYGLGAGSLLPNLSEDSAFDEMFPRHPLSIARWVIERVRVIR